MHFLWKGTMNSNIAKTISKAIKATATTTTATLIIIIIIIIIIITTTIIMIIISKAKYSSRFLFKPEIWIWSFGEAEAK